LYFLWEYKIRLNPKFTQFTCCSMNKKWAVKRITINLASNEAKNLEKYCEQTGRPATDVIRELIRALPMAK